jgi:two-component system copper resistance phosphate regulon response regulator CusR
MKILLVEDEPKVLNFIKVGLSEFGHEVDTASDGMVGKIMAAQHNYDLFILDVMLPTLNGIDLCKNIRQLKPDASILMLTALGSINDKLQGFESGADDYVVKPFEFKELLARIKSVTRRSGSQTGAFKTIRIADLELNLDRKIAVRNGDKIELTAKEFMLLELLMKNKNKVISRKEIAQKVWGEDFDTGTNVVEVYINFLRKKIDKNYDRKLISTSVGLGYCINED